MTASSGSPLPTSDLVDVLKLSDSAQLTVVSNSMSPLVFAGDSVLVEKIDSIDALVVGDIVVASNGRDLFTHRFFGVVEQGGKRFLQLKGDRKPELDALFSEDNFVGRVGGVRRNGRYLSFTSLEGQTLHSQLTTLAKLNFRLSANPNNSLAFMRSNSFLNYRFHNKQHRLLAKATRRCLFWQSSRYCKKAFA